jgi:hypothetical protein
MVSAHPLTWWISKIIQFSALHHNLTKTMKNRSVWLFRDELSKRGGSVTPIMSAAGSHTITCNSLDLNVLDHHSSRMPKPIVSVGKQISIHTCDTQRKLITGLNPFRSELPIQNKQPAKSWMAPAMNLTKVGCLRICADSDQRSYSLSKEGYSFGGHQIERIPLVRRHQPVSLMSYRIPVVWL